MKSKAKSLLLIAILSSTILSCKKANENNQENTVVQKQPAYKPTALPESGLILRDTPESGEKLDAKRLNLFNQRKCKEAIEAWMDELNHDPQNAVTLNNIGIAYSCLRDYEAAITYHKKAIEVDPNYGHGYYSLGLTYYYRPHMYENYGVAKEALEKAVALNYRAEEAAYIIKNNLEPTLLKLTPEIKKYFLSGDSFFKDISFPQKAIIAKKSPLYDKNFVEIGELAEGDIITIIGLYDRLKRNSAVGEDEFFYLVSSGKGLVKTNYVAPRTLYDVPTYISPKRTIQVIKTPISTPAEIDDGHNQTVGWEYLWLKLKNGNLLFLDDYVLNENPISWSPDEQYFFVSGKGKIYSSEGELIWDGTKSGLFGAGTVAATSPVWDSNLLFVRGVEGNDAVYLFSTDTKEFKEFLNLTTDGEKSENGGDGIRTWPAVEIKNGIIKASFVRVDNNPPDKQKACVTIEVTADKNGKIIKKEKKSWDFCD